ncbi:hypothetical protein Tco_0309277 [Tanacetum coccineum]
MLDGSATFRSKGGHQLPLVRTSNISRTGQRAVWDLLLKPSMTRTLWRLGARKRSRAMLQLVKRVINGNGYSRKGAKRKPKTNKSKHGVKRAKSKVIKMKKIQLEGPKLPKPQVILQKRKTRVKIAKKAHYGAYSVRSQKMVSSNASTSQPCNKWVRAACDAAPGRWTTSLGVHTLLYLRLRLQDFLLIYNVSQEFVTATNKEPHQVLA